MEARTTIEAADISVILNSLPHRYPFLLVDRMIDIRRRRSWHRNQECDRERAAFSRPFPQQSGVAGRTGHGGHGADRGRLVHSRGHRQAGRAKSIS